MSMSPVTDTAAESGVDKYVPPTPGNLTPPLGTPARFNVPIFCVVPEVSFNDLPEPMLRVLIVFAPANVSEPGAFASVHVTVPKALNALPVSPRLLVPGKTGVVM
jgi:hypothetical protein